MSQPTSIVGAELCEHGKRYCAACGTTKPEPPLSTPEQWSLAYARMLKGKERAARKEKAVAQGS